MSGDGVPMKLGECLLEAVQDPVYLVDAQGTVLTANRAAARQLGDPPGGIVGRPLGELFPPNLAEWTLAAARRVIATGEPHAEERVLDADGETFVFQYVLRRLDGEGGQPSGALCVARDVTGLATVEGDPGALFERTPDALFTLDSDGRLHLVNRQAELVSGYRRDMVESLHFTEVVPPDEGERLRTYFADRLQGRSAPNEFEVRYLHASGEERWAEVRISRRPASEGVYAVSVRDVTPRKRTEAARRDFLHMVSHGVKTPLAIIHGYSSALSSGRFGELPPPQQMAVDGIRDATERVRRLMDQFLLVERLELGDEAPSEPGCAAEAIGESVRTLEGEAEGRGIRLTAELDGCSEASVADAEGLRCVVENFLSNALKFTPAGGAVQVKGCVEGGTLRLDVEDTGTGIATGDLPKIFDRFYRVRSSAETWGSGLGLYIVRRWVERMGGSVEVRSCLENGTCFTVRIPLSLPSD